MNRKAIGLACAMAVVMPGQGALAATGSQSVTADVANTLEATFPGAYAWGELAAGAASTSAEQTITVKSNALWGLKLSTDQADGRMTEWDGSAYDATSPKVLTNPLTWRMSALGGVAQATSFVDLSNVQALITGSQSITGDAGRAVGVTFRQNVSYADTSAGANDYRILVTYDASQGY